jgi:hypothetical protein
MHNDYDDRKQASQEYKPEPIPEEKKGDAKPEMED